MEPITKNILIKRGEERIELIIEGEDEFTPINLSEDSTSDLKSFFNEIFNYIIESDKLVHFELVDGTNDLLNEVATDVLRQINAEIKENEESFKEFIELSTDK